MPTACSAPRRGAKSPRASNTPASGQPASPSVDPLDPTPRQFPMYELWDLPCGAHPHPPVPLGCGIHGPQDYNSEEEREHKDICINKIKLRILDGSVGPSRLHDALDLAARTSGPRKTGPARKRVRFALDSASSIFEESKVSYIATELVYEDALRAASSFAYFCADRRCGCKVDQFFRTENEHDAHVSERRAAEGGDSDDSGEVSGSEREPEAGSEDEQLNLELWIPSSEGVAELKRKREGDPAPLAGQEPPRKQSRSRQRRPNSGT